MSLFPSAWRVGAAAAAAVVLLSGSTLPSLAQTTTPDALTLLQQLVTDVSANNVPAAMALFTNDAIVIGGPCHDLPDATCVGKAQLQDEASKNPANISLLGTPQVSSDGSVVTFKLAERFEMPPAAAAAGVQRYVESGTALVQQGRIARLALVADLTDPQTATLVRLFASFGPPPAAQVPVANDGQSLATQPASTQIAFLTVWGDQAAAEWVKEHNASLAASGH